MPRFVAASNRIYRVANLTPSGSTFTPNFYTSDVCDVFLNGGNFVINEPTGIGDPYDGQRLTIRVRQDGTGGRTVTWNSVFEFVRSANLYLNPNASAVSNFEFMYREASDKWVHLPNAEWGVSRGVVGYAERLTPFTSIPSDGVGVVILTLTGIPVLRGRTYQIIGHGEVECDTASPSRAESHIKFTTNNTTPTVSSTDMTRELSYLPDMNVPATVHMVAIYRPSTSHTLGVALHAQGVFNPSHQYTYYAESDLPIYLSVEDVGPNPS